MPNMLATFAQFERRLISQRTKEALAVKRARRVRLGRPPTVPKAVLVRRIQRQRARGDSLRKIAKDLNEACVPTAEGGARWYATTVRHVLLRTS
jgi:DNA invertase Pin-like site-specific DNA recombinase